MRPANADVVHGVIPDRPRGPVAVDNVTSRPPRAGANLPGPPEITILVVDDHTTLKAHDLGLIGSPG
jgi:hypothetical protein